MAVLSDAVASEWNSSKNWSDLLKLNADFYRKTKEYVPASTIYHIGPFDPKVRHLIPAILRLHEYGLLVVRREDQYRKNVFTLELITIYKSKKTDMFIHKLNDDDRFTTKVFDYSSDTAKVWPGSEKGANRSAEAEAETENFRVCSTGNISTGVSLRVPVPKLLDGLLEEIEVIKNNRIIWVVLTTELDQGLNLLNFVEIHAKESGLRSVTLTSLPAEMLQSIRGLLDGPSIHSARQVSRPWRKKLAVPLGKKGDQELKETRHKRVWASVDSTRWLQSLLSREQTKSGENDVDLVLIGCDIEYIYEMDLRKQLDKDYTPCALVLLRVADKIKKISLFGRPRLKLFNSMELSVGRLWSLGMSNTCVMFFKQDLDLHHVAISQHHARQRHMNLCETHQVCLSRLSLPTNPACNISLCGELPYGYELDCYSDTDQPADQIVKDVVALLRRQEAIRATSCTKNN